ncbi:MAG: tetratricopeptide repeat protein [Tardiphaga sp.]|nr:tetratricopeptide repeat protein [Tardiphaga sp.]
MNIRLALLIAAVVLLAPVLTPRAEAADNRIALVIGNSKYPDAETPLKEPVNDAREIADELKKNGFDVDIGENLSIDGMRRAIDRLYARIKPGTTALLFYSGIGIQSNRQSYMVPVDAQIWTEPDVRRDGFGLETLLSEINSRGASVKVALMDASRRNPFERRFRSFSAGLAPVVAPSGTLVMYSAALSSVVADGGSQQSLFVGELLKAMRTPGLTGEETLNRTRTAVIRASKSEQVPWISSSLADDFSFIPGQTPSKQAALTPPKVNDPESKSSDTKPSEIKLPDPKIPEPKPFALKPFDAKPSESKQEPGKSDPALADDPIIRELTDRLASNPNNANTLYRRGQVYASKGAYALAIKDFDEALRINPRDVEAYNNRCWARTVVGDLQAALRDCNEALRLRPSFVDALDSRGLVNLKSGMAKNAIADFDAALRINPRLTSSLYGRGLAKQRVGSAAEGDIDIANAKAMDPNIVNEFDSYGVR